MNFDILGVKVVGGGQATHVHRMALNLWFFWELPNVHDVQIHIRLRLLMPLTHTYFVLICVDLRVSEDAYDRAGA